jgi:hypothetical protein
MSNLSLELSLDERLLLLCLRQASQTGEHLMVTSGLSIQRFEAVSKRLWETWMLQGTPQEGCCGDPCGSSCISARNLERVWSLTDHANQVLCEFSETSILGLGEIAE